jgi:hypothetical protein
LQDIKLAVDRKSLSAIFRDWQIIALACIPNDHGEPVGTKYVWEQTNNHLQKESGTETESISRASVINFLEKLHELDLLVGVLCTGKGGKRYHYTYQVDRAHFNDHVSRMLIESLVKEYPDVNMMMVARVAMSEAKNQ